jgi:ACR3 family arsenite transporter
MGCRFGDIAKYLEWYALATMVMGTAVGSVWPELSLKRIVPVALFVMIYPSMIDIEMDKIVQAIAKVRIIALALGVNFLVCPLLISALASMFSLSAFPDLMIGAIIFGIMPCGGMVTAYTDRLGGNNNLSVAVMALSLLLCTGIVPVWMRLLLGKTVQVPMAVIALAIMSNLLFPLLAAMLTRKAIISRRGQEAFDRMRQPIKNVSMVGLIIMIFVIFVSDGRLLLAQPFLIVRTPSCTSLFLVCLLMGTTLLSRLTCSDYADSIALIMSTSVKNTALAMALAISVFGPAPALVIGIAGPIGQLPLMIGFLRVGGGIVRRLSAVRG